MSQPNEFGIVARLKDASGTMLLLKIRWIEDQFRQADQRAALAFDSLALTLDPGVGPSGVLVRRTHEQHEATGGVGAEPLDDLARGDHVAL